MRAAVDHEFREFYTRFLHKWIVYGMWHFCVRCSCCSQSASVDAKCFSFRPDAFAKSNHIRLPIAFSMFVESMSEQTIRFMTIACFMNCRLFVCLCLCLCVFVCVSVVVCIILPWHMNVAWMLVKSWRVTFQLSIPLLWLDLCEAPKFRICLFVAVQRKSVDSVTVT